MEQQNKTVRLYITGMTCKGCKKRIEQKLNGLPGMKRVQVNFQTGVADITYDPEVLPLKTIASSIESLGYTVSRQKPVPPVFRTVLLTVLILVLFGLLDFSGVLNLLVPSQLADSSMGFGMLFVIGLMTSVHCIAMCGGIHLSQCLPREAGETRTESLLPTLAYNFGRVISYTLTGLLLGLVGGLIGGVNPGISTWLQGILKIIAGVFMVVMGLGMLNLFPFLRRLNIHLPHFFGKKIGNAKKTPKQPLIVGLLNGLMPCGPLQSMQIVAFASGNPLTGALSMLFFGLGTLPLMLGFGSLVSALGRKFARAVTTVGSVLVVILGLSMLSQGGNLSGLFSFSSLFLLSSALAIVGIVSILPYKEAAKRTACVALAACICAAAVMAFSHLSLRSGTGTTGNSRVEIVDGVQVVYSTLNPGDYPDITVQANLPVRWMIDAPQGSINGCNNRMVIHEYGIEYTFQTGENVIVFTPTKAGDFSYSCWMGMIHGNIRVTE